MAELRPFEDIDAGGVDSRSNPINLPRNRALRCLNWCPKQAGFWELRWGYTSVSMSTVSASAIHSMFSYRQLTGGKYVLFMQGTTLKTLDTATGSVTTPPVRGNPVASGSKGQGFFANNRFHFGNGTDQKFFDGTTWRDSGLPQLQLSDVSSVVLVEGARELKPSEASSITLTAASGGSFPADTYTGRLIYVVLYNIGGDRGPATIYVASGRIKVSLNQKITVANMPNLASENPSYVKLMAGTMDGTDIAYFFTNTSSVVTAYSVTINATLLSVTTSASHGLSPGDVVSFYSPTNPQLNGVYLVSFTPSPTTLMLSSQQISGGITQALSGTSGTVMRIVKASNTATSIDITANTQDLNNQANDNRGLAASAVGGPNPGYQFYACIYNPITGHVGNRIAIGNRALQTAYRSNWVLNNVPSTVNGVGPLDSEWYILIGRTGDGAEVPYTCEDIAGNFAFSPPGRSTFTLPYPTADPNLELPSRNGIIPSQCSMFCVAGDYAYAADSNSPFLRRSASFADYRAGLFQGQPEQSWAPDDLDTFPTAEAITGMFEIDQEVFCGTIHDCALSVNLAGVQQWTGPWNVGIAGPRAGTKCGAQGFFWVSGDKQLCMFSQGVPIGVSDEYELAELAQIGDAYLSQVECVYYRDVSKNKEELRIEGRKSDGTPYTIIHDFKLREPYSAPGSIYGQGYSSQFQGPLAVAFTSAQVRDSTGKLQIYCGASNGQMYQLYTGADDVGSQYTADLILLINGGTQRPSVPFFDFYGDQNVVVTLGRNLSSSIASGAQWGFDPPNSNANVAQAVPGSEQDFLYRVKFSKPEVQRLYVRFQLTSHSADGNLNLNSPIHVPLENYGRIYEIVPAIGDERSR